MLFVSSGFFERYLFSRCLSPLVSKIKHQGFSYWRHFALLVPNLGFLNQAIEEEYFLLALLNVNSGQAS